MARGMTTVEFVKRAKQVHGKKYDYEQTEYVNMRHKVRIHCPIHGMFEQLPQAHLRGQGCPVCGVEKQKQTMLHTYGVDNPMKLKDVQKKARKTCLQKYGHEWAMSSQEIQDKMVATNQERYGVAYPLQSDVVKDKMHTTVQALYGVDFVGQVPDFREKMRQTVKERYGSEEVLASPVIREKIEATNRERYGGNAPMVSPDVREKYRETVLSRYGVSHTSKLDVVMSRIANTKKEHGTFGTSSVEEQLYSMLISVFGKSDVKRQYSSDEYPFSCDFYVPSRDMYLELNASWTHGSDWFDGTLSDDIHILNMWQSRNTKYYQNAIYVWTQHDVQKRSKAAENKLNYVVFWDTKLRDAELWIAMGCPDGHDWDISYSWLPKRRLSTVLVHSKMKHTAASLSKVSKSYQSVVFYARERCLWEKNPVFRGMRLQAFLYWNRWKYLGKLPDELTDIELIRGFSISGILRSYTGFDSSEMRVFLQDYQIQSVYDPCAGWGERMLCCYTCDVSYTGIDVNDRLMDGYHHMISDFQMKHQVVYCADSAVYVPLIHADAVITCPPYGSIEKYSEEGAENLEEDAFLEWWKQVVNHSLLVSPKYFCFQVNQKWKARMLAVVQSFGFSLMDEKI